MISLNAEWAIGMELVRHLNWLYLILNLFTMNKFQANPSLYNKSHSFDKPSKPLDKDK